MTSATSGASLGDPPSRPHSPIPLPAEVLLLVFLHGFKGGSDTFAQFPERVQHLVSSVEPTVQVQTVLYPPYDTRGELIDAVTNHVTWLDDLYAQRVAEYRKLGGEGPVRVVLMGHSMGGLVIADSAMAVLNSADPRPDIMGLIAYDTPYYGLNPSVFKNTAEKFLGYAQQGHALLTAAGVGVGLFQSFGGGGAKAAPVAGKGAASSSSTAKKSTASQAVPPSSATAVTTSSSSGSTTPNKLSWFSGINPTLAGAVGVLAAGAGAAYWKKDEITTSWSWATSHLSFVGELWKMEALEGRMEKITRKESLGFHCFYTLLPKTTTHPSTTRTFIVLPASPKLAPFFAPNTNTRAADEIGAHVEMFTDHSDGIYELGNETCRLLRKWLEAARVRDSAGKGKEKQ